MTAPPQPVAERLAPCIACGEQIWREHLRASDLFSGDVFPILRCAGCGLGRTLETLEAGQEVGRYTYGGVRDAGGRFVPVIQGVFRRLQHARIRLVDRIQPVPGRVLDVGCGSGEFLGTLSDHGWDVWGTELDAGVAETAARRLGARVCSGCGVGAAADLRDLDLVVFWHSLEHLEDPLRELAEARRRLAPGGRILVSIPNPLSWQARLSGQHWLHLDVPRHRWHLPWPALELLAKKIGLRAERLKVFSLEHGVFPMFQAFLSRFGLGRALFLHMFSGAGRSGPMPAGRFVQLLGSFLLLPLAPAAFLVEAAAYGLGSGGVIVAVLTPCDASPGNRQN